MKGADDLGENANEAGAEFKDLFGEDFGKAPAKKSSEGESFQSAKPNEKLIESIDKRADPSELWKTALVFLVITAGNALIALFPTIVLHSLVDEGLQASASGTLGEEISYQTAGVAGFYVLFWGLLQFAGLKWFNLIRAAHKLVVIVFIVGILLLAGGYTYAYFEEITQFFGIGEEKKEKVENDKDTKAFEARLATLQADVERLSKENDGLRDVVSNQTRQIEELIKENDRLMSSLGVLLDEDVSLVDVAEESVDRSIEELDTINLVSELESKLSIAENRLAAADAQIDRLGNEYSLAMQREQAIQLRIEELGISYDMLLSEERESNREGNEDKSELGSTVFQEVPIVKLNSYEFSRLKAAYERLEEAFQKVSAQATNYYRELQELKNDRTGISYMLSLQGIDYDEILEEVKRRRPDADPENLMIAPD